MAAIAKSGTPSLASLTPQPGGDKTRPLVAGEALGAFDACYIKADGTVWKSTGAAANAAAKVRGYAPQATSAGEVVTLLRNVRVRYGASLTPGSDIYLSGATAGALADAASTGGTAPIGYVETDEIVHLWASRY